MTQVDISIGELKGVDIELYSGKSDNPKIIINEINPLINADNIESHNIEVVSLFEADGIAKSNRKHDAAVEMLLIVISMANVPKSAGEYIRDRNGVVSKITPCPIAVPIAIIPVL